jgi:hypothetical protein
MRSSLLIYLLIGALIFGLAWWALSQIPLPQPVRAVVIVILVIVAILFLLRLLPAAGVS